MDIVYPPNGNFWRKELGILTRIERLQDILRDLYIVRERRDRPHRAPPTISTRMNEPNSTTTVAISGHVGISLSCESFVIVLIVPFSPSNHSHFYHRI
jgi:hypothetical protein